MMVDRPREVLGRYITVQSVSNPRGFACKSALSTQTTLRLVPMIPDIGYPLTGEHISCVSAAGRWDSIVTETADDYFDIQVPEWVSRSYARAGIRVSVAAEVRVELGDEQITTQLFDVSTHGLAVSISDPDVFRLGATVVIHLPAGAVPATVRTIRRQGSSDTWIVGFELADPSPEAKAWLLDAVENGRLL